MIETILVTASALFVGALLFTAVRYCRARPELKAIDARLAKLERPLRAERPAGTSRVGS